MISSDRLECQRIFREIKATFEVLFSQKGIQEAELELGVGRAVERMGVERMRQRETEEKIKVLESRMREALLRP